MTAPTITQQLPQLLSSIALLLWPILVLIALFLFRPQLANLLTRIRKGGGVEFDPSPQPQKPSTDILPKTDESVANVPLPRTPATCALEEFIRKFPAVASKTEPRAREQVVITLAARVILISIFEQVEATIWASQIDLLTRLHSTPDGASREDIQRYFYQPAASRHAAMFASYSYDSYLNFLMNWNFVEVSKGRVHITNRGREYLAWRVDTRKAPKMFG